MSKNNIYGYLERLSEILRIDARQGGAKHGLQPVQLEVLHYLSMCNRFSDTPIAVSEYLGQTKGTMSQTIKVLETKGLVRKETDPDDKRVVHLSVSEEGNSVLDEALPGNMFVNASEALSDKEVLELKHSLEVFLKKLQASNDLKPFGVCKSCRYNSQLDEKTYFCNLVKQPLTTLDVELICREHTLS